MARAALAATLGASYGIELLSDSRHEWQGPRVFVTLSPAECPAHIYRLRARRSSSERDFNYFI
jgi:hypothetical protein